MSWNNFDYFGDRVYPAKSGWYAIIVGPYQELSFAELKEFPSASESEARISFYPIGIDSDESSIVAFYGPLPIPPWPSETAVEAPTETPTDETQGDLT